MKSRGIAFLHRLPLSFSGFALCSADNKRKTFITVFRAASNSRHFLPALLGCLYFHLFPIR